MNFVHLHVHNHYSLLDGLGTPADYIKKAKSLGMPGVAFTNHGNMFNIIEGFIEAKNEGIRFLFGQEFYVAENRLEKTGKNKHLVLIAKDLKGYKNLMKLSTDAFLNGFYYNGRTDLKTLFENKEGLICLTACLKGIVNSLLLENKFEEARKLIRQLKEEFKDDLYFEIMPLDIEEQRKINQLLISLSEEFKIKFVVTNDVHYLNKEDSKLQEILLQIKIENIENMFKSKSHYFASTDDIYELFSRYDPHIDLKDITKGMDNTMEVFNKCDVKLELKRNLFPSVGMDDLIGDLEFIKWADGKEITSKLYLQYLCNIGWGEKEFNSLVDPEPYLKRVHEEVETIDKLGFVDYFIIVHDFIKFARDNNIMIGPGRGSAAGSLVCYLLGITNIDPIKYKLFFHRFLNSERKKPPDIDLDFEDRRREEIFAYIINKYGKENVANIITFHKEKPKGAIKDIARVFKVDYLEVNDFTTNYLFDNDTFESMEMRSEPRDFFEKYPEVLEYAKKINGTIKSKGIHPAGIVISNKPIYEIMPLQTSKIRGKKESSITTQFDMDFVNATGMLKIDILGLSSCTIIKDIVELVKKTRGIDINLNKIPYDDQKVFDKFSEGDLEGVFQFSSSKMKEIIMKAKPTLIEHLCSINALFRPGPISAGLVDKYIYNKKNPQTITYMHPMMESILKDTYGICVYQEQVMEIVSKLGGLSLGEADVFRMMIDAQKVDEKIYKPLKKKFFDGCINNGIEKEKAEEIYQLIESFSGYSFNKSHALAYSIVAYQSMFLKLYYLLEFLVCSLNSRIDEQEKLFNLLNEASNNKIELLRVDINKSSEKFKIENGNAIRLPFAVVKGIGEEAVKDIVSKQPYSNFEDIYNRADRRKVQKRVMERLIFSDAFFEFDNNGKQVFDKYLLLRKEQNDDKRNEWTKEERSAHQNLVYGFLID